MSLDYFDGFSCKTSIMRKLVKLFIRLFDDKISIKYQRYNLIKIGKENKHLSDMDIIKLKYKYLDSVEESLNNELKSINQRFGS